jgi:predicted lipid-binding transport protein (Tim44 family)
MKRMVLYLLLGTSLVVLAQQQFERAQESAAPAGQAEDGAAANEGDAAAPEADPESDPESDPEAQGAPADDPGPVAETEAAAEDEEASQADLDFEPDEEISEDYPVPLPSDI